MGKGNLNKLPFFFFLYKLFIILISSYKRFQRCLWQMSAASICLLPGTSRLPERFQKLIVVRGPQLLYRLHTWQVDLPSPRCRTQRLIHLSFFKVQWQFHQLERMHFLNYLLLFKIAHQIMPHWPFYKNFGQARPSTINCTGVLNVIFLGFFHVEAPLFPHWWGEVLGRRNFFLQVTCPFYSTLSKGTYGCLDLQCMPMINSL